MLVATTHTASRTATALVSRAAAVRVASPLFAAQAWPAFACPAPAARHANAPAPAIDAMYGIDARFGGEGKAKQATGASLLPATAATGTEKSRHRRPRIPSP